jgi:hypothetical protein
VSRSEHSDDWLDGYTTGQADAIKVKSLVADGAITTLAANVERLTKQLHGATEALNEARLIFRWIIAMCDEERSHADIAGEARQGEALTTTGGQ